MQIKGLAPFNLGQDIGESDDLSAKFPDRVRPMQKLVEDMSVALAGADVGIMASLAVPELVWLHIGKKPIEGQDAVLSAMGLHKS